MGRHPSPTTPHPYRLSPRWAAAGAVFLCLLARAGAQGNEALLYFSNATGPYQLHRLLDGTDELLVDDPAHNYWWAFTNPASTKFLAYRSDTAATPDQGAYNAAELMLFNIDGSGAQLLIDTATYHWAAHGVGKFSPDGGKILMAAEPVANGPWYGFVTDSLGQDLRRISDWFMLDPAWSPDGSKVVFCAFPGNVPSFDLTQLELHVGDYDPVLDTLTNIVQITSGTGRVHDPCFSHTGDRIVISDGNLLYTQVDIRMVDADGSNPTTVFTDGGASGGSMCWSADDQYIWFHNLTYLVHPFQVRKVNVATGTMSIILQSIDHDFIGPHLYVPLNTAIADLDGGKAALHFHPNPLTDRATVQFPITLRNATLTVMDALGRTVFRRTGISWDTFTLERNGLPAGLYHALIRTENRRLYTGSFMIAD